MLALNEEKILTSKSEKNHSYARKPINAHPDFYGFFGQTATEGNPRNPTSMWPQKTGRSFGYQEKWTKMR